MNAEDSLMNEILKDDDAVGRPPGPVLPFEHRTSQVPTGAHAPSIGPMAYATEQTPLEPV